MSKGLVRLNRQIVRELILTQRLKKWWVAEATGIHKTTLRRWLSGNIECVGAKRLERLAITLGAPQTHLTDSSATT